jgi:orotidine-5'-phosphate decarboxylase
MSNPIILALDVPNAEKALTLVEQLAHVVGAFKIGSELFTTAGPDIVRSIRSSGASVFLDLKYHDIPHTVAKSVAAATRLGVQMLSIHACGGLEMMRAAEAAAQDTARNLGLPPPLVLGVTVLTSIDSNELSSIGLSPDLDKQVERLASLAVTAGLRGLVCSPRELPRLRQLLGPIQLVTPGIRDPKDAAGDQKRTLTASQAIAAGATWIVVGRPIWTSENPRAAAQRILDSLRLQATRP